MRRLALLYTMPTGHCLVSLHPAQNHHLSQFLALLASQNLLHSHHIVLAPSRRNLCFRAGVEALCLLALLPRLTPRGPKCGPCRDCTANTVVSMLEPFIVSTALLARIWHLGQLTIASSFFRSSSADVRSRTCCSSLHASEYALLAPSVFCALSSCTAVFAFWSALDNMVLWDGGRFARSRSRSRLLLDAVVSALAWAERVRECPLESPFCV